MRTFSLLVLLLLLPCARPAQAANPQQRVYLPLVITPEASPLPMVNEIVDNGDGTCTAWWGYDNPYPNSYTIPIDQYNIFHPYEADRGQVTAFYPGRHERLFSTTWSGGYDLHWTIHEYTATARWFTCLHPLKP